MQGKCMYAINNKDRDILVSSLLEMSEELVGFGCCDEPLYILVVLKNPIKLKYKSKTKRIRDICYQNSNLSKAFNLRTKK